MPRHLSLFDLDGTLIAGDSNQAFGEFMASLGWIGLDEFHRSQQGFHAEYDAGRLDLAAYVDFVTRPWRDRPAAEVLAARERFMQEVMHPRIDARARALVRQHRERGDLMVMVTATNDFVTAPIAQAFGIDDLLAVQLETGPDGRCTGRFRGTPTFREGKVERLHQWLAGRGQALADFESVTVYSDSPNDLPLLAIATHAVATNPTPALEAEALQRGWRILRLLP
ncbi:HAD superfamily hydrolase (TIGR01490 family) [Sphaerotilus hippei]|uniref:HAD superfamily hydrolase (TIGR01490 family) n=1 Tax=Sphaerotilus hippei TaxID=744406 RepID=A0A318GWZ1_9BURK|nr:HAD family hydrolase [Sphaerotilus hippei]PXW94178.1 HAD superfamily hydrolase (TIGR01490 family) [Sphaerotilus hippei]